MRYNLTSVIRAHGQDRVDDVRNFLNRELQLYSEGTVKYAKDAVANFCPRIDEKIKAKGYVDDSDRSSYESCVLDKDILATPKLPRELALKSLDSLKELEARGLVLLAAGSMVRENDYWGHTGVMPKELFEKIAADGIGDNDVGIGPAKYDFNGKIYEIEVDVATAIEYLDFTDSYDPSTRKFAKKYQGGSLGDVITQTTNSLIAKQEDKDPYFRSGASIRKEVVKNMATIIHDANTYGDQASHYAQSRVLEIFDNALKPQAK